MGGYGSGKYNRDRKVKATVEKQISLSIQQVKYQLTPGQEQVSARLGNKALELKLTWTNCYYGGKRPWFVCPQCDRRVGVIYQKINEKPKSPLDILKQYRQKLILEALLGVSLFPTTYPIGCRKCLKLNYESQQVT